MKKLFLATCFVSAGIGLVAMAIVRADQGAEKSAQEAAQSWLALVDSGKYSESWDEAAQVFKGKSHKGAVGSGFKVGPNPARPTGIQEAEERPVHARVTWSSGWGVRGHPI
jgi:Protein of unknown function (DUF4019)